jgi:hypothetical protein
MAPAATEVIDLIAKSATAVGVLFAGWNLRRSALIRKDDLRWRAAMGARDLLADIHRNDFAVQAVAMIDCHIAQDPYDAPSPDLKCRGVTKDRIREALLARARTSPADRFIYQCFDWLVYYIDRIGYLHSEGLIQTEDVRQALRPYLEFIDSNWDAVEALVREHGYAHVQPFARAMRVQ